MRLLASLTLLTSLTSLTSLTLLVLPSAALAAIPLEQVMASIERHHPTILAAQKDAAQAQAELVTARGGFDPLLTLRASGQPVGAYRQWQVDTTVNQFVGLWGSSVFAGYRVGDDFPAYFGDRLTKMGGEVRVGVNVPLWRNGPIDRTRAGIERATENVEAVRFANVQQLLQLKREGSLRYWDWVAAACRQRIASTLLVLATDRDAALIERSNRGDLAALERTDNERVVAQRRGQLILANRFVQQTAIELSIYLRTNEGVPIVADGADAPGLPEPDAISVTEAAVDEALARRPEPKRWDALLRSLRVERKFAANQRAPGIDAFVMGSLDIGDPRRDLLGNPIRTDLDKPVLALGLVVDVPIPNRAASGRVDAADASIGRTEEQRRLARDRIRADVEDARSALATTKERVAVARQEVALAKQVEEGERRRFEAGDGTMFVVNLREQMTAESQVREIDALVDYQRAVANFRAATGKL